MRRILLSCSLLVLLSHCGVIGDAINNVYKTQMDMPIFKPADFSDHKQENLSFAVDLSGDDLSYVIPESAGTKNWGPILAKGDWANIVIEDLEISGATALDVEVDIFSRDEVIYGADQINPEPQDIAACSFTHEEEDDLGTALTTCTTSWLQTNGIPAEFDMRVTFSEVGAGKDENAVAVALTQKIVLAATTYTKCKTQFKMDEALKSNASYVTVSNNTASGYVATEDAIAKLSGEFLVYDAEGAVAAKMTFNEGEPSLSSATFGWLFSASDPLPDVLIDGAYEHNGETYNAHEVSVAGNTDAKVTDMLEKLLQNVGEEGYASACWAVQGEGEGDIHGVIGLNFGGEASLKFRK